MTEKEAPRPSSVEYIPEHARIVDQPIFQAMREQLAGHTSSFATGSDDTWGRFCYAALLPNLAPHHPDYEESLPKWAKYRTRAVERAVKEAMSSHLDPLILKNDRARKTQQQQYTARYRLEAQRLRTMAFTVPVFSVYLAEHWHAWANASVYEENGVRKSDEEGAKVPTFETFLSRQKRDSLLGLEQISSELDYSTPEKLRESLRALRGRQNPYRDFFARIDSEAHR